MKRFSTRALTALCLTLCLSGAYPMAVLADSKDEKGLPTAEIMSFGQVQVNGSEVVSGTTLFPGSTFATAKASGADINLGKLGRVRCMPESAGKLNFDDAGLAGSLDAGKVLVSKPEGFSASFTTKDGLIVAGGDEAAVFVVDVTSGNTVVKTTTGRVELRVGKEAKTVAAGEMATVGKQDTPPADDDDDDDTGGLFWLGVAGYTATVVGAIIYAVTHDDDVVDDGSRDVIQVSPFQ